MRESRRGFFSTSSKVRRSEIGKSDTKVKFVNWYIANILNFNIIGQYLYVKYNMGGDDPTPGRKRGRISGSLQNSVQGWVPSTINTRFHYNPPILNN